MRAFLRTGILVLAVWLELAGISFGKQVFLRDDSVIECESFWRRQGQVVVKVNRDVLLEFAPEEVDLRRTFPPKHKAKAKGMAPKQGATRKPASSAASGSHELGNASLAVVKREYAKPTQLAVSTAPKQAVAAPGEPEAARPARVQPATAQAVPAVPAPAVKAQPEPAGAAAPEPSPAVSQVEFERRAKENAQQMAEAIKKQDPELMKKAVEAQKNLVLQQKRAGKGGQRDAQGVASPKPEPPWFKYLLMLTFCVLLIVVALWVVFAKAGESGWKILVPFYNYYLLMLISGKPGWWFLLSPIPVVGQATYLLAMLSLAEKFGRSPAFGVGIVLLPMIFFPLLAFGPSQYQYAVPAPDMNFTFSEEV